MKDWGSLTPTTVAEALETRAEPVNRFHSVCISCRTEQGRKRIEGKKKNEREKEREGKQ